MQFFPPVISADRTTLKVMVAFFNQNDNNPWQGADGNVQCAPTNNAEFAFHHSPRFRAEFVASGLAEPEDYYKRAFESAGYSASDRGDHGCHSVTLKNLGIKSTWTTAGKDENIVAALRRGETLVAGFNYKEAGHITQIVGFYGTDLGGPNEKILGYLIHDCYGLRNGSANSYGYINPRTGEARGAYDPHSYDLLQLLLFDGPRSGAWVRFFEGLA
jgi:hypothetical protein